MTNEEREAHVQAGVHAALKGWYYPDPEGGCPGLDEQEARDAWNEGQASIPRRVYKPLHTLRVKIRTLTSERATLDKKIARVKAEVSSPAFVMVAQGERDRLAAQAVGKTFSFIFKSRCKKDGILRKI